MPAKPINEEKRAKIERQAASLAKLLGVDEEEIMLDPHYGVSLTVVQAEKLLIMLDQTPCERLGGHNYESGTCIRPGCSAKEPCTCRCQEGRHCGGCGHEGCGYSKSAWELRA